MSPRPDPHARIQDDSASRPFNVSIHVNAPRPYTYMIQTLGEPELGNLPAFGPSSSQLYVPKKEHREWQDYLFITPVHVDVLTLLPSFSLWAILDCSAANIFPSLRLST